MCSICPDHECAHFWQFSAICYIFGPMRTMFRPHVHAGRLDQWTTYGMQLMHSGPHDSHFGVGTKSYAKVSMDNFAILALVGTITAFTMPWPMEIFGTQVRVGPHWTPIGSHTER